MTLKFPGNYRTITQGLLVVLFCFMWTIFKVFFEFVTILLLLCFGFFGCEACGILDPPPGIEPTPSALEGEVLTTGLPGKSQAFCFCTWKMNLLTTIYRWGMGCAWNGEVFPWHFSFCFFQKKTHGQGVIFLYYSRFLCIIYMMLLPQILHLELSIPSNPQESFLLNFDTPVCYYYHQGMLLFTITQKQQLYARAHTQGRGRVSQLWATGHCDSQESLIIWVNHP